MKAVPNNWHYYAINAPANVNFQLSGGFNVSFDSTYPKFGGIFGATYNSNYRFSDMLRSNFGQDITDTTYSYHDSAYTRTTLASALANFTLRLNATNKIYFNNVYSINSVNQTTLRHGYNNSSSFAVENSNAFYFASNKIYNAQLGGDHFLPGSRIRIKWSGFYTNFKRDEPDYRRNLYVAYDATQTPFDLINFGTSISSNSGGIHFYGKLEDIAKGANADVAIPFKAFKLSQTFKTGGGYFYDSRTRDIRFFTTTIASPNSFSFKLLYYGQDSVFSPANYGVDGGLSLLEDDNENNHYEGFVKNPFAFVMFDNKFTQQLRFVWGVRFESYHQQVKSFDRDATKHLTDTTYKDWLPSANLIYAVLPKANIRLSYSRTVARPLFRELASQVFYDFLTNTTVYGNPVLTESHINNYEVRWEHYFNQAQYYSVSFFYKKFKNPIEQYIPFPGADSRTLSWQNAPSAKNYGIEIEGRKNFDFISKKLETLVAYANIAFIKSKVVTPIDTTGRPLQGQSPYALNASLQYTEPKTNLSISVLFNAIGPRIYQVGSTLDPKSMGAIASNAGHKNLPKLS